MRQRQHRVDDRHVGHQRVVDQRLLAVPTVTTAAGTPPTRCRRWWGRDQPHRGRVARVVGHPLAGRGTARQVVEASAPGARGRAAPPSWCRDHPPPTPTARGSGPGAVEQRHPRLDHQPRRAPARPPRRRARVGWRSLARTSGRRPARVGDASVTTTPTSHRRRAGCRAPRRRSTRGGTGATAAVYGVGAVLRASSSGGS